jgi:putative glutamine amidotransferase
VGGEKKMRPKIGFTSLRTEDSRSVYKLFDDNYARAIVQAGGIPLVLPSFVEEVSSLLDSVDGLLIPGGLDIHSRRFGEELHPTVKLHEERDDFEMAAVHEAVKRDIPVLAICRGAQILNVALGGSLWQDLPGQAKEYMKAYGMPPQEHWHDPAGEPAHGILIKKASMLFKIQGSEALQVNTHHHQALKAIPSGLAVTATAPDGVVEAVELPGKRFVLGVQWHPECLFQKYPEHFKPFSAFVDACRI